MAGLHISLTDGNLTIGGIPMKTHGWNILDLRSLWMPATIRGADKLLPGAAGVRSYPRRKTVTEVSLPMVLTGEANANGVAPAVGVQGPTTAYFAQLEANIAYLRANVVDPIAPTTDGTRTAVLTMPSGATRTGKVLVVGLSLDSAVSHTISATLTLSVPGGTLV